MTHRRLQSTGREYSRLDSRLRTVRKRITKTAAVPGHSPVRHQPIAARSVVAGCEGGPQSVDTGPYFDTTN